MKLLLDTHLLIWGATRTAKLSAAARKAMENPENELIFSSISIWEIAIKYAQGRADFDIDPTLLRYALLECGYVELPFDSDHALAVQHLPDMHKDPFDRAMVAQARAEHISLLTADKRMAGYGHPVRLV